MNERKKIYFRHVKTKTKQKFKLVQQKSRIYEEKKNVTK